MRIVRYRPAFFTGFDRDDDVVDSWDQKLTADSNAHWFKEWIDRGNVLTLKKQEAGKYFRPEHNELQHYVMGEKPGGAALICALVHEQAPADWKWLT